MTSNFFITRKEIIDDGFDLDELIFFSSSKETDYWNIKLFFFNGLEREIFLTDEDYKDFILRLKINQHR